ncbi:hypothetical protein K0U27_02500 [archaeon]|nr:hypothetical protein [archaeon]
MEKKLKISLIVNIVLAGILLGLVLSSTLFVEPMFVEVTANHNELQPWLSDNCDYDELVFINKTSTILDEPWHGQYVTNFLGLPDDLMMEDVEKCMDDITEKRKN